MYICVLKQRALFKGRKKLPRAIRSLPKKFKISAGQTLMVSAPKGESNKLVVLPNVCYYAAQVRSDSRKCQTPVQLHQYFSAEVLTSIFQILYIFFSLCLWNSSSS